jgi:hypothetical protein
MQLPALDGEYARRDLLLWSAPIIHDILADEYRRALGAKNVSRLVHVTAHAKLWRALLSEQREAFAQARGQLNALARKANLELSEIDAIDGVVIEELLEVVAKRFARSPENIRAYTRMLMRASNNLAQLSLVSA